MLEFVGDCWNVGDFWGVQKYKMPEKKYFFAVFTQLLTEINKIIDFLYLQHFALQKGKMLQLFVFLLSMYTVTIKVKLYVLKFLENKFGTPVNFPADGVSHGAHYYNMLQRMLAKPSTRYDSDRSGRNYAENDYLVSMQVQISAYLFYHYGWELTDTDQMAFNSFCEGIIKELLCYSIMLNGSYNNKIISGIRNFREITGLTEDDYPHDTIKQYLYRVGFRKKTFSAMSPKINHHDNKHFERSQI